MTLFSPCFPSFYSSSCLSSSSSSSYISWLMPWTWTCHPVTAAEKENDKGNDKGKGKCYKGYKGDKSDKSDKSSKSSLCHHVSSDDCDVYPGIGNPACSPQVADVQLTSRHCIPKPQFRCDGGAAKAKFTLTALETHGTATLRWHVKWDSLSSDIPAFRGITLNGAVPGKNGPVMLSLSNLWFAAVAVQVGYGPDDGNPFSPRVYQRLFLPCSGQISGSFEIPPTYVAELLKGKWYVIIHTERNMDGELRGQICF